MDTSINGIFYKLLSIKTRVANSLCKDLSKHLLNTNWVTISGNEIKKYLDLISSLKKPPSEEEIISILDLSSYR